jgi:hypothetical protein
MAFQSEQSHRGQNVPTRAPFLRSEDLSARRPAVMAAVGRRRIWIGIIATIAAGIVYLIYTSP